MIKWERLGLDIGTIAIIFVGIFVVIPAPYHIQQGLDGNDWCIEKGNTPNTTGSGYGEIVIEENNSEYVDPFIPGCTNKAVGFSLAVWLLLAMTLATALIFVDRYTELLGKSEGDNQ